MRHHAILMASREDETEPLHIGVHRYKASSWRHLTEALTRHEIQQPCKRHNVHERTACTTHDPATGTVKADSEPMKREEKRAAAQRKHEEVFRKEKPRRE